MTSNLVEILTVYMYALATHGGSSALRGVARPSLTPTQRLSVNECIVIPGAHYCVTSIDIDLNAQHLLVVTE